MLHGSRLTLFTSSRDLLGASAGRRRTQSLWLDAIFTRRAQRAIHAEVGGENPAHCSSKRLRLNVRDLIQFACNRQSQLALYVISFDYDLEKVVSSTRIPLRSIASIQKGAYILSPLQEAGRDSEEVRMLL